MKKYQIGIIMAVFAFIAMLPQQAFASGTHIQEAVQLEQEKDSTAVSVCLTLPNAAGEQISSLQLSLKTEEVSSAEFKFDSEIVERAKVHEARYNKATGTMNVYIAGTAPLYAESESTITLGKLLVSADRETPVKVTASDVKLVRGIKVEGLDLTDSIKLNFDSASDPETPTPGAGTPTKPAVTPKATKVTKIGNGGTGIAIRWKKSSNASGYYILRKTAKTSWKRIATVKGSNKLYYVDKTVREKNGRKYYYTVKAYNGSKVSSFDAKGKWIVRMAVPTLTKAVSKTSKKMLVKWKRSKKATGYRIQYSTSAEFDENSKKVTAEPGKITSKTLKKLKKKTTYYVRMRCYRKENGKTYFSRWSDAKEVKVK